MTAVHNARNTNAKETKARLMQKIQAYSFATAEAILYLDTHPHDTAALAYFNKYRSLLAETVTQYENAYGPITATGVASTEHGWSWTLDPWPWEYEAHL